MLNLYIYRKVHNTLIITLCNSKLLFAEGKLTSWLLTLKVLFTG